MNDIKPLSPNHIKDLLHRWVDSAFQLKDTDVLINELGFYNKDIESTIDNTFRADVALANGRLVGFEIKSEKDSLKRWPSQMSAYTNVFDEVWLCTHGKHLECALKITHKNIGILLVDSLGSIAVVRNAKEAASLNNVYDLSGLLWKDEVVDLAKKYDIAVKARTTKREVRDLLANSLTIEQVRPYVLEKLKARRS